MDIKVGQTTWFDLPVSNLSDAMAFYEGLLGWTYRQMDNSPLSDYVMIDAGGQLIGGLRKIPSSSSSSSSSSPAPLPSSGEAPILYFTVEKLAPKVARAKELGAETVGETVDLGIERGRYQWIKDREGNLIGLWASE